MKEPLLSVQNLSVDFHVQRGIAKAVDGVSFDIAEGETLGIVGESGSGKSVSSLAIMDLLPKKGTDLTGKLVFEGHDLLKMDPKKRRTLRGDRLAMIFQEPMTSLNPLHSCGKQIMEPMLTHKKWNKEQAKARTIELLALTGIPAPEQRFYEYPHQMSGGMRQRIMIAMALACDPQLLIADEPTTALDVTIQAQILSLLKDLQTQFQMSVMMITHDLGVISEICKRVIVMYAGQIVEQGDMKAIFDHPMHPYTAGLIKAIPKIGGDEQALHAIDGRVPDIADLPKGCTFEARCPDAMPCCALNKPAETILDDGRRVCCFKYSTPRE